MKNQFPLEKDYFPLPSDTECYDGYDEAQGLDFIRLKIDGNVDYGLDYAFEFIIKNAMTTPPEAVNEWRRPAQVHSKRPAG